ncbi:hypothetical protein F5Y04DRAFT_288880, partial [Hypomontagnella monticulosa]
WITKVPPEVVSLAARPTTRLATALTVVRLSVTTVAAKVTSAESALRVPRRRNHATAVVKPAISAVTVPRAADLAARSVTLRATAPNRTVLVAATVTVVATVAAAAKVARRATPAAVMVTCLASVSTVANATTVVRTVTSLATAPRFRPVRRFATSARRPAMSRPTALTERIHHSETDLDFLSDATRCLFLSLTLTFSTFYEGGWRLPHLRRCQSSGRVG